MTNLIATTEAHVPPHPRAVIEILRSRGCAVNVRRNKYGSFRYSIDGGRELNALQMTNKLDRTGA